MNRIKLLLISLIAAFALVGCGKPNPPGPDLPTPDRSCGPETTWTSIGTNSADLSVDAPYGTLVEGFRLDCSPDNVVIDTAWVSYSDTYDQDLEFYLQNLADPSLTYNLVDSTGSTVVHQPPNYSGVRRVIVTARNIPAGTYTVMVHYRGTIRLAQLTTGPLAPSSTMWHATIRPGRLAIGCIVCQPRRE